MLQGHSLPVSWQPVERWNLSHQLGFFGLGQPPSHKILRRTQEKAPITENREAIERWLGSQRESGPPTWTAMTVEEVAKNYREDYAFRWELQPYLLVELGASFRLNQGAQFQLKYRAKRVQK